MKRSVVLLALSLGACLSDDSAGPFDWSESETLGLAHDGGTADGHDASSDARIAPAADGSAPMTATPDASSAMVSAHAFSDAPAFVSAPVATTAKQAMAATGTNPTKAACLGCHDGKGNAPARLTGGTVFVDKAGTRPAADREVRIVDTATKRVFSTHTDADGNFWIDLPKEPVSGPFLIGVRDVDNQAVMPLLQRGLDCNATACHGGAQGPVHVP